MKSKYAFFTILLFLFTLSSAQSKNIYKSEVLKLYPDAKQIDWEKKGDYKVALFDHNAFEMKVWLNKQAEWVMSVLDILTTDELPPDVYNAYTFTQYSQWDVLNVYWVTFPDKEELFIVKVNQDNSSQTNDLIFSSSGELVNNINVSDQEVSITPSFFDIND